MTFLLNERPQTELDVREQTKLELISIRGEISDSLVLVTSHGGALSYLSI